jgi:hypothetical protein
MLSGAPAPQVEITAEDTAFINTHTAEINQKLGADNESYRIIGISRQVVAGTNHFFHLEGKPSGHIYTATIYEPLPGSNEVTHVLEVSHGQNHHKHGHS